jgi:pantoate--beta-alanine ligase
MRIVTSVEAMQSLAKKWKRQGKRTALVPTMGYLHEGHVSLMRRARKFAGRNGIVVVSIYINPTQFGPSEDLKRYPRDLPRDKALCRKAATDVIFVPSDASMYKERDEGQYSTYVVEESLSKVMEGVSRPTHFRGVTTVVAKLFNIVMPDAAIFGAKDFQQAAIIQRMVADLNFPVRIVVGPTVREPDGLAMSSRNKYLQGDLRAQAVSLWRSIEKARAAVRGAGRPIKAAILKKQLLELIQRQPAARVDYIEFFDPETLEPRPTITRGTQMALAVFIWQHAADR